MAVSEETQARPVPPPPVAARRPVETVVHGVRLVDDYAWLKAENWQEVLRDPDALPHEIRAHLESENRYAEAVLAPLAALRETLVGEMRGRMKEDDESVPLPDGPFAYYRRFAPGAEHPLLCRRPREGGEETVLLDAETLAKDKEFFDLGQCHHSPDHRLFAWSVDEAGSEYFAIHVRDLATGEDLPGDVVADTSGEIVWAPDSSRFFYVEMDENHRPRRVKEHRLGTPACGDRLVYEEGADGWFVDITETQSGRFLVIAVADHETSEATILDMEDPAAEPRLVAARETGLRYSVEHHGERLLIRTNSDGAEDFKIVAAPVAAPDRSSWRDVVPHRPGIMVLSLTPYRDVIVRTEREDGNRRIVLTDPGFGAERVIAFPEETYSLWMEGGHEFETRLLRFVYSSMTTPAETYDFDMITGERRLLKRQEIPSGHDPSRYVTRRLFARAEDGVMVPISVLHRRDTPRDGIAPCLLYGYGAYGAAIPANFDSHRLSLVDRGFVFAIAHIRGGTEKGWGWYLDGKRENKPNSFKDFVACAHALCEERYTAPGRIVAQGRSAGGMLMGAVANMAPELFAAVLAEVPFVDVLNTILDASLPLTPPEWPEWGNPITSERDFALIRAYSPYDQVAARRYPAILALGGLTDPRVTYWEPAKWVARLRAATTGGAPIVLHTEMDSGHAGSSGRFDRLKEIALSYAFALGAIEGRLAVVPRDLA
jgi:oligopeptidase B